MCIYIYICYYYSPLQILPQACMCRRRSLILEARRRAAVIALYCT